MKEWNGKEWLPHHRDSCRGEYPDIELIDGLKAVVTDISGWVFAGEIVAPKGKVVAYFGAGSLSNIEDELNKCIERDAVCMRATNG